MSKAQDPFNPYMLYPSDHPGLILVSQPLQEDNYGSWSHSIKMALNAKHKFGLGDGFYSKAICKGRSESC